MRLTLWVLCLNTKVCDWLKNEFIIWFCLKLVLVLSFKLVLHHYCITVSYAVALTPSWCCGWPHWFLIFLPWNWKTTSIVNNVVIRANFLKSITFWPIILGIAFHNFTSRGRRGKVKGLSCPEQMSGMQLQFDMSFVSHNRAWELADIGGKSASPNDSFLERFTSKPAGKPFYLFFLIVSIWAWRCAPALMCVHCALCMCVPVQTQPPPHYTWLVDGCWLSHLPEFVPARCGGVTGKAPKHSSILTIVQHSVGPCL